MAAYSQVVANYLQGVRCFCCVRSRSKARVVYKVIPEMNKIVGDSARYTVRGFVIMNKSQPSSVGFLLLLEQDWYSRHQALPEMIHTELSRNQNRWPISVS